MRLMHPSCCMVFLGVLFDSKVLTLSVTHEHIQEILYLIKQWLCYDVASHRQYQVLLGKLNVLAACVHQGRIFVSRIIAHMKILPKTGSYPIPNSVSKDLLWA